MGGLTPEQVSLFVFLRSTASEMRRLADRAPELAIELQHIARQLESELERFTSLGPQSGVAKQDA